jgi:microcystin degradation protein MlrC
VRKIYEDLRDELLADLKAALLVDMVLLSVYGAIVAEGYDDCEGDLLSRCRDVVGPDTLVAFKASPHIDTAERAEELYAICRDKRGGQTNPVRRSRRCHTNARVWHYWQPS